MLRLFLLAASAAALVSPRGIDAQRPRCAQKRAQPPQMAAGMLRGVAARGGFVTAAAAAGPDALFNTLFGGLAATAAVAKVVLAKTAPKASDSTKDAAQRTAETKCVDRPLFENARGHSICGPFADPLQTLCGAYTLWLKLRFLPVFWVLRMSDWLQGPYFYEVYASKSFGGVTASLELVSRLFLTGFGTTAVFGPTLGRLADARGRKLGTVLFAAFYAASALSTKSPLLWVLFAGRACGGLGTALLSAAPEAWVVGDAIRTNTTGALGDVFGAAYAGDALVAITAGQLASMAAASRGASGPFELSVGFVTLGAILAALTWPENKADTSAAGNSPTIRDAFKIIANDRRIALVGAAQALFEGAMYVFVMQWPPALSAAIAAKYGATAAVPFGKVFSCFMVSCLLGTTAFGAAQRLAKTEASAAATFALATGAMAVAANAVLSSGAAGAPLAALTAAFFAFEFCVGLYFPSIGTLRSKYVPDSHRTVILAIFGIPLNVIVVSVFLSIKRLGVGGALSVSTTALALATAAMLTLLRTNSKAEAAR